MPSISSKGPASYQAGRQQKIITSALFTKTPPANRHMFVRLVAALVVFGDGTRRRYVMDGACAGAIKRGHVYRIGDSSPSMAGNLKAPPASSVAEEGRALLDITTQDRPSHSPAMSSVATLRLNVPVTDVFVGLPPPSPRNQRPCGSCSEAKVKVSSSIF